MENVPLVIYIIFKVHVFLSKNIFLAEYIPKIKGLRFSLYAFLEFKLIYKGLVQNKDWNVEVEHHVKVQKVQIYRDQISTYFEKEKRNNKSDRHK